MFKLVLNAGHGKHTPGKRCLKSLDKNETREWILNSRICRMIENLLSGYEGIDILRVDDRTGDEDIPLSKRTKSANNYNADFYLSIHHNAGINGGNGGGIVAFTYTNVDNVTKEWQKDLYNNLIRATGLKGNRATPLSTANFHECRETRMPAVLLELGFMDSKTDVPVILSEKFAEQCATAITEVIVKRANLKKNEKIYRVQVGAFKNRADAEKVKAIFESGGYSVLIV